MGTGPTGIGLFLIILSRISWIFFPVLRSITASTPCLMQMFSFASSSSSEDEREEFPMLALTLHLAAIPIPIFQYQGRGEEYIVLMKVRAVISTEGGVVSQGDVGCPQDFFGLEDVIRPRRFIVCPYSEFSNVGRLRTHMKYPFKIFQKFRVSLHPDDPPVFDGEIYTGREPPRCGPL